MKTPVKILLFFLTNRRHPDRPGAIMCRITANRECEEFTTSVKCLRAAWDNGGDGRLRGTSAAVRTANASLVKLRDELTDIWADLERLGKPVTANSILRRYKANGCPVTLVGLYEAFMKERRQLVGIEIAQTSASLYGHRLTKLTAFLESQRLAALRPEELTHTLADKLLYWLVTAGSYNRNTANKMLQTISQVLRWGVRRELLEKNPLDLYRLKSVEAAEIKHLTTEELESLTCARLPVACLEAVRDCFVFQCWTGLAYADLAALDLAAAVIETSPSGRRTMRVRRAKSTLFKGYECGIVLMPEAERLLAKYGQTLPVPTNQIYNRYLKQIGDLCGIDPAKMTSHVGRKTAGVLMLNRGIRMEVVSKFLGHSSVKMTEKVYAKILDKTLVDEFDRVFPPEPVGPETGGVVRRLWAA